MWSSYLISAAVCYLLLSVSSNIYIKIKGIKGEKKTWVHILTVITSVFWCFSVPLLLIGGLAYILNKITGKVADNVLFKLKKGDEK